MTNVLTTAEYTALQDKHADKSATLTADKPMTNQQRHSEAVHIIMTARCDCGAGAAVKHGNLIYCAGCWLDKYGPEKHKRKRT